MTHSPPAALNPRSPAPPTDSVLAATYRRSYRRLVGLACLLTGSRDVAEDLVQDAFVRSAGRVEALDDPDRYLSAAVANACRSWHRHNAMARRVVPPQRPDAELPDRLVELDDALGALKHDQRVAVVLQAYCGFSAEEIATVTGSNASTVRTRIQRGLAALRKAMPDD